MLANVKIKAFIIMAILFVAFWAFGFLSSFFAGSCTSKDTDNSTKITACGWASRTTLAKYFEADHPEYASIEIERVIALAQAGEIEAAATAMRALLRWAHIDSRRQGNTGNPRDDSVAAVIFSRIQALDRNSNAFLIFSQELGFQEGT